MQKKLFAIVAVCLLVACTQSSQPGPTGVVTPEVQVQPGRQFDLGIGQEARIQGSSVVIRFTGVSEDSRCPSDVQCVWAGDAAVRLALSGGPLSSESTLHTTLDPKSVQYAAYTVRLVGVKPTPKSGSRIADADYLATLEVTN